MFSSINNHPIATCVGLVVATATFVAGAFKFMVFDPQESRVSFLEGQLNSSQQQISNLQSMVSDFNKVKEVEIKNRLSDMEGVYETRERLIRDKAAKAEASLESCQSNEGSRVRALETQCQAYANFLNYAYLLKEQETAQEELLTKLHDQLIEDKESYEGFRVECEKDGAGYGNVCEIASSKMGGVQALEAKIKAKQQYLSSISQQLLALPITRSIE